MKLSQNGNLQSQLTLRLKQNDSQKEILIKSGRHQEPTPDSEK